MIPFTKMQGIGNDFVMLDALRDGEPDVDLAELSRFVNDRRFGIGGDGLIIVGPGYNTPFRMRMFNPDGSESEMCGNGIRCLAKLVRDHGHSQEPDIEVETGAGVLNVSFTDDGRVRVDMGPARLTRDEIGMRGAPEERFIGQPVGLSLLGTAVSMGNPHLVIFVNDAHAVPISEWGPRLEHHELFPARTNVHFAEVMGRGHLVQRTWERGAGITLACGTGACAVAVAAVITGRTDREVDIRLPGGNLSIFYAEDGRVHMTGPAQTVFEGKLSHPATG